MCGCDALHGALRSSLRAAFEENRLHPRPAQPGSSTRSGGGLGGLVYTPGGWVRSPRYAIGGSSSPPQRSHFPGQRDWYLSEEASHHLLEGVLENLVHVYGDPHVVHPPSGSSPSSGHTPRPKGRSLSLPFSNFSNFIVLLRDKAIGHTHIRFHLRPIKLSPGTPQTPAAGKSVYAHVPSLATPADSALSRNHPATPYNCAICSQNSKPALPEGTELSSVDRTKYL